MRYLIMIVLFNLALAVPLSYAHNTYDPKKSYGYGYSKSYGYYKSADRFCGHKAHWKKHFYKHRRFDECRKREHRYCRHDRSHDRYDF